MTIRWLISRDLPDVLKLEEESFDVPWNEDDFKLNLKQRNVIGMVLEEEGVIQGYMIYALEKKFLQLLNLGVGKEYRRQGVGTQLIERLQDKLSQERRTKISAHVRESNLEGLNFFKACGFKAVSVIPMCYTDTNDDGYEMCYNTEVVQNRCFNQGEMI